MQKRKIVAGCLQFRVHPGNVSTNLSRVESALPEFSAKGCRLLILPEMWSTGFDYDALEKAAKQTPYLVERLKGFAEEYGMVLVGSLPDAHQGKIYNTSYVFDRGGGLVGTYRKIHLFSLHGEHLHFGRGNAPLVCNTSFGRLGVMICYDLRFPELSRRLALDGAEILCISALWPKVRIDHWSLFLQARAVENQLFVIGCNGCGEEGGTIYGGASAIVSPTGMKIAEAGDGEEKLMARMDLNEIQEFRSHIPCFEDRLSGVYGVP